MPTALVTGGAVRLGRAIVLHLAENGYDIALHYGTSEESAEQTADEVRKLGARCKTYSADFTDFNKVVSLMGQVLADFNTIEFEPIINPYINHNIQDKKIHTLKPFFLK